MDEFDKTVRMTGAAFRQDAPAEDLAVTVFDGGAEPRSFALNRFGKNQIYFGRGKENDIVLDSALVSREHGRFARKSGAWVIEDKAAYQGAGNGSTNGLTYNNAMITSRALCDGDLIRIDDAVEPEAEGVLLVFSASGSANRWQRFPLAGRDKITIGHSGACDISLPHVSVSRRHAQFVRERDGWSIIDTGSTNGVIVNERRISGRSPLREKDVIVITNTKLIFTASALYCCSYNSGVSVDAADIVIRRGSGNKSFVTSDHVTLGIRPGELVAIIGGSGAGKSTILNCMCGYLKPTQGKVFINGVDLYQNFDSLKKLVGYVPQSDIVYDNLTLHDMLLYTAKLRLPGGVTDAEREEAIRRAIETVELTDKRDQLIKSLSGGQRKRASIAVELLSDPNLLFLDEPASGLDPGTERSLMQSLRKMADGGKTVILVTHSTLQLQMCDKIVFMGRGGKLCYCGPYDGALRFFGVSDVVDVYNMITEQAPQWSERYRQTQAAPGQMRPAQPAARKKRESSLRQLGILSARCLKLTANDQQRLLLLMLQAPLLAALISLVADGNEFEQYEMTKSMLFALSCSAFWVGMLNAIQEVCKERTILKREYMAGLSLGAYITSKLLVLGLLCLVQSALITGVFALLVGLPESGVFLPPLCELLITTFATSVSAAAMGLFVSSMFTNADRAMTVAPILLMPQILFSGLIFTLDGATEFISWMAVCRWSMEGYGTTANLNNLPLRLQQLGVAVSHVSESFFEYTESHLLTAWGILALFTALFLILARGVLSRIGKEQS